MSGNYITLQPGDGEIEDTFVGEDKKSNRKVNEGDLLIHLIVLMNLDFQLDQFFYLFLKKSPLWKNL